MARTTGSHSGVTGPRVRHAALKLFAQHGYAAVSMRQIAQDVGVQAGALYNYTPDKQSLLFDLMRTHLEELMEGRSKLAPIGNPTAQLEQFTRFHLQFHAERPDEVFIAYMELRNLTRQNFIVIEGLRRRYENELQRILRAGVSSGDFSVRDTKVATMAVIAMLTGVNTWFREGGRLSLGEVENIYRDMVRRSVGA
ncbi:TetR/AcrR family transcriptional regulator [Pseudopelagicola sp. nBUS_20]|uniref:TetR/AcrR family transcriptional regulator n=1 Tax=Pseudopelagicola sp. nBUS_20 TaxID=3395317 RepID=UPI003EB6EFA2